MVFNNIAGIFIVIFMREQLKYYHISCRYTRKKKIKLKYFTIQKIYLPTEFFYKPNKGVKRL